MMPRMPLAGVPEGPVASPAAVTGGCLCGAVRFKAERRSSRVGACHCGMCRRWSGGLYMAVACEGLEFTETAALGRYVSSDWAERLFCTACGSSLAWQMRNGSGHAYVSASSFDDAGGLVLDHEVYIDEKPGFYALAGERPRRTGAEIVAEFTAAAASSKAPAGTAGQE